MNDVCEKDLFILTTYQIWKFILEKYICWCFILKKNTLVFKKFLHGLVFNLETKFEKFFNYRVNV